MKSRFMVVALAMVALMCFVFLKQTMPPLALVAVVLISLGIFLLALVGLRLRFH